MKKKKKASTKDKVLITIFSIIIVIALCSVAAVALLNYRPFQNQEEGTGNDNRLDSNIITPEHIKNRCTNFLIAGIDYTEASHGGRGKLTDVIMVVSFDLEGGEVNVLQIPRDTYVGEEYNTGKINAIYSSSRNGGIDGLASQINKMLQIPIDHYATINMDGFITVVDALGGVDVEVPHTFTLEGVTLEKGMQHLDGKQAEILVRERHSYANADLGRIETQQVFLKAMIKKCLSMSTSKIVSLAPTLIKEITTDLSLGEMLGYYEKISGLNMDNIHFYTAPNDGAKLNGTWRLWLKADETAALLNEKFRPYSDPVPAEKLNIIEF